MSAVSSEDRYKGKRYRIQRAALTTAKKNIAPEETRHSERVVCRASIVYEYYDPENFGYSDSFEMGDAKLCNYSHGGMCLELPRALKPDLPVFIKLDESDPVPGWESAHGHHVEVIWCRQPTSRKKKDYRIGVRFYESPLTRTDK